MKSNKHKLTYDDALLLFEQKKYAESHDVLQKLCLDNKDNIDLIYFLGVVKSKLGDFEKAIPLFETVAKNKTNHVESVYNLALCYHKIGINEKALENYKKALEINPFLSEASNNIAVIYRELNNIEEAEKFYRQAIKSKPGNNNAVSNLSSLTISKNHSKEYSRAVTFYENKEYTKSIDILLSLYKKDTKNLDILNSLGIVYFSNNDFENSYKYFSKIIEINENNETAHYSIGVCHQSLENYDKALISYKRAIEINPRYLDALNNVGLLYSGMKNFIEAEECFTRILNFDPEYFNAITNLGSVKLNQDKFEEAAEIFNKALSIIEKKDDPPNKSVAYSNIGFVNMRQKKFEKAIEYFNKAIELNPDSVLAHYNRGETYLMMGKFEEGWKDYEWRTGRKDFGKRHFEKTIPENADLNGKKVLVYAEQGVGDAIQFIRYLPLLKKRGCYIIFECDKNLFGLLENFNGIDEIIERNLENPPDINYDYDLPLLSLPGFFNTTMENIPAEQVYLKPGEKYIEKWSKVINNKDSFKIGIVWAGSPIHTNDRNRSCRLKQFAPLMSIDGTKFYSLQKGFPLIQAKDYQLMMTTLDDFGLNSFSDTAGAIENLDLVITVDTSVAHLAAAVGKQVWVLIPYMPDWRWLLDRTDSPWYPTMKLYRQPKAGDWDSVFKQIRNDLVKLIENKNKKDTPMTNQHFELFTDFFSKIENETYPEVLSPMHSHITTTTLQTLIDRYQLDKDAKILDIGCGQGPALDFLSNHGYKPIGITLNDEDVNICRSKGYEVYKMDQSFLEFGNQSFDFLWVRHCLEHSIAPYYTLSEFARVMKPGGLIYVEVPAPDTDAHHERNPNHYSVLSQSMWVSLIMRAGFDLEDIIAYKLSLSQIKDGKDEYWGFICKKRKSEVKQKNKLDDKIYLGLSSGDNFGWGVCSKYLKKELSKKLNVINIDENEDLLKQGKVDGKVFHALVNKDFSSLMPVRGKANYGYTFFEYELSKEAIENSKNYDFVIGGSTWNKEKLESYGVKNAEVLIQGVDPELFYPGEKEKNNDLFIIFSGGKFEFRKGQDLVLKAIKILQEKYNDIILINAWYNIWPETVKSMAASKYINFELKGDTWKNFMVNLCQINDIDGNKVFTLPLTPGDKLRDIYLSSDIGLFPNRCEGGTNLVLMEYMACGKPVIASYNSGHKDVLNDDNSIMLRTMHEFKLHDEGIGLIADWEEPDIDEIVAKLEYAYNHRDEIRNIGKNAGEFMKQLTWAKSADKLLEIINK